MPILLKQMPNFGVLNAKNVLCNSLEVKCHILAFKRHILGFKMLALTPGINLEGGRFFLPILVDVFAVTIANVMEGM